MKGSVGMYIIIVLVIALAAGLLLFGNDRYDADDILENETEMTEVEVTEGASMADAVLADGAYAVNTQTSKVAWTGSKKVGGSHTASMMISEGQLMVSDGHIDSGNLIIDVAGLTLAEGDAGGDQFYRHVTSEDFLAVEEFPTATLTIKSGMVTKDDAGAMTAKANLALKGETKEIMVPFSLNSDGEGIITVVGTVEIDRTEWGIRFGSDRFFDNLGDAVIEDMVSVSFTVVAAMDSGQFTMETADDVLGGEPSMEDGSAE